MERQVLFTKPFNELREAFVAAELLGRIKGDAIPSVAAWLAAQRACDPSTAGHERRRDLAIWELLIQLHGFACTGDVPPLQLLLEYAQPATPPLTCADQATREYIAKFEPVLSALSVGGMDVYTPYASSCGDIHIVCVERSTGHVFLLREGESNSISTFSPLKEQGVIDAATALRAILATWYRGGPKAAAARAFLCGCVERLAAKECGVHEAAFNNAVAVSADGTKIVCANHVVVRMWDGTFCEFPAEAFREHKILLEGYFGSMHAPNFETKSLETMFCNNILKHQHKTGHHQVLFRLSGDQLKVFLTTEDRCPDYTPMESWVFGTRPLIPKGVRVSYPPHQIIFRAGATITEVVDTMREAWDMGDSKNIYAYLNGMRVEQRNWNTTVVHNDDDLQFHRSSSLS